MLDFKIERDNSFAEYLIKNINFTYVFTRKAVQFYRLYKRFEHRQNDGLIEYSYKNHINDLKLNERILDIDLVSSYSQMYKKNKYFPNSIIFKVSIRLIVVILKIFNKRLSKYTLRYI